MSGGLDALALKEDDVTKFLSCSTHIGSQNVDFQMEQYVYKRKNDGIHIINLRRTWEKLLLAARAIVAIENPADVCVISSRPYGQRAVLKFASYTGATPIAGRYTPGTFTNQIQAAFREPRLLVTTDPHFDHQAITEASYVNIPVISFGNTDAPLRYVDICIPCNNKGAHSIGLMWWMLCREVLRLRGTIGRETKWEVMVDLFFFRDPEEAEKEELAAQDKAIKEAPDFSTAPAVQEQWADTEQPEWSEQPGAAVDAAIPAGIAAYQAAPVQDWSAPAEEWNPATAAVPVVPVQQPVGQPASDWGGAQTNNW